MSVAIKPTSQVKVNPGKAPPPTPAAKPEVVVQVVQKNTDKPLKTEKKVSELAMVVAQIRKDHGEKTVVLGYQVPDVRRAPTGDFEFDFATGGGFPKGRFSIIYGPESSCKSNLAYRAIAVAQRGPEECNKAVLIDLEHAFNPDWAASLGVDIMALHVVKPGYGEEAVDILDAVLRAEDVAIVVVDSLAVLVSSKEIEQSVEKYDVGTSSLLAKRMTNKAIVALAEEAKRDHDPALIFINQIRYKIGVMFGNPETTPGGKAILFASSMTVRVSGKPKLIKEVNPDTPVMKTVETQIIKSKVGIIKSKFDFDMVLVPFGDFSPGETDSWGMVKDELQAHGLLVSEKGQWRLDGILWKTQQMIRDNYNAEPDFALKLQQMVIAQYSTKKFVLDDTKKVEDTSPEGANGGQPVSQEGSGT